MSQDAPESQGVLSFLQSNYAELKMLNPLLPMAIRTAPYDPEHPPLIIARYDFGTEQHVNVCGFTEEDCAGVLKKFVDEADNFPKSDESVCQDLDVVFRYSKEPGVYEWRNPYSILDDSPNF